MRAASLTAGPITGEIEPVDGADIAVEHLAELECQVDRDSRFASLTPRGVQPVDRTHRLCRGVESLATDLIARCVLARKDREHAIAEEFEDLAAAWAQ